MFADDNLRFSLTPIEQRRVALGVSYNGAAYNGWQTQLRPHFPTVQEHVEIALSKICNHPVKIYCAGRTDARVHGTGQVVHFDIDCIRSPKALIAGANVNLPLDIRVNWAVGVPEDFHARFSAVSRTYRYFILNTAVRPAIADSCLTWVNRPLDHELMHQAAQSLLGRHDFTSFRGSNCQSNSAFRKMLHISVTRQAALICVEVCANAFLLHMVRNIVGSLLAVGAGDEPLEWFQELLGKEDRSCAGMTAPPNGLFLCGVEYPEHYALPTHFNPPVVIY